VVLDLHEEVWVKAALGVEMPRKSRYDVPAKLHLQIGDEEPDVLASFGIPYPYDVRKALPRLLRELAAQLEEQANESRRH
jgi:hypothetical protein